MRDIHYFAWAWTKNPHMEVKHRANNGWLLITPNDKIFYLKHAYMETCLLFTHDYKEAYAEWCEWRDKPIYTF